MTAVAREEGLSSAVTPGEMHASGRSMAFLALAAAGCAWGTGFYFTKVALTEMGVGHMLLYRFAFGCLGLLPVALRLRAAPRRPRRLAPLQRAAGVGTGPPAVRSTSRLPLT